MSFYVPWDTRKITLATLLEMRVLPLLQTKKKDHVLKTYLKTKTLRWYQKMVQQTSFLLVWPAADAAGLPGLTRGPLTTFIRSWTLTLMWPNFYFMSSRYSILKPPEPDSFTRTSIFSERHREHPRGNLVVAFGWLEIPRAQVFPPVQSVLTLSLCAI